jgi:trans-aconitate 2-methyltransferase
VESIVEWVKGSGLRPFLERMNDREVESQFLEEYKKELGERYKVLDDGKVALGYRRFFVVGVKREG